MDRPEIPGYEIEAEIGTGGMGVVYRARHVALDRVVALKVIHPRFTSDPQFVKSFATEAKIAARLTHPNIVPVYDFGWHEGIYYLSMQYVLGQTIRDLLAARRPSLDELVSIVNQVASALDYAHREQVVHRDVKTGNFLLCPDGKALVIDFGVAHGDYSTAANSLWLGAGTRSYMSPEQCKGFPATARSDQYSLAIAVYEMLAGRLPFAETDPKAVMRQHISETPVSLCRGRTDITARMDSVVQRALSKIPEMRYASVGDFARDLEAACREAQAMETIAGRPQSAASISSPRSLPVASAPLTDGAAAATLQPQTIRTGYVYATRGGRQTGGGRRWAAWAALLVLLGGIGAAAWFLVLRQPVKPVTSAAAPGSHAGAAGSRSSRRHGSRSGRGTRAERAPREGATAGTSSGAPAAMGKPIAAGEEKGGPAEETSKPDATEIETVPEKPDSGGDPPTDRESS